jgi:hypothetical protein
MPRWNEYEALTFLTGLGCDFVHDCSAVNNFTSTDLFRFNTQPTVTSRADDFGRGLHLTMSIYMESIFPPHLCGSNYIITTQHSQRGGL